MPQACPRRSRRVARGWPTAFRRSCVPFPRDGSRCETGCQQYGQHVLPRKMHLPGGGQLRHWPQASFPRARQRIRLPTATSVNKQQQERPVRPQVKDQFVLEYRIFSESHVGQYNTVQGTGIVGWTWWRGRSEWLPSRDCPWFGGNRRHVADRRRHEFSRNPTWIALRTRSRAVAVAPGRATANHKSARSLRRPFDRRSLPSIVAIPSSYKLFGLDRRATNTLPLYRFRRTSPVVGSCNLRINANSVSILAEYQKP